MRQISLFLFILFLGLFQIGRTQTFIIEPEDELQLTMQPGTELAREFFISNTHHESIWLGWEIVSNSLPNGWNYSLCDNRICYNTVPSSSYMEPIDSGSFGFLRLTVWNTTAGSGEFVVRIFNEDASESRTVTFRVTHLNPEEKNTSKYPSIYPNPIESGAAVSVNKSNARKLELFDAFGKRVYSNELSVGASSQFTFPSLPVGIYFAQFLDDKGQKMVTQKVIVR